MRKILLSSFLLVSLAIFAQREVPIAYGDMDNWVTRHIKESSIIGGNTRLVYEIGPNTDVYKNEAYKNMGGSPWGSANVYAKVAGVEKSSTSVFKEKRGDGFCARLETYFVGVKVLGLVNIRVLAAGSIFLGEVKEPITGTKNPQHWIKSGIPFTKRPSAIKFDYKIKMSGSPNRVYHNGLSPEKEVAGVDYPAVILLLQKRWEKDGKIYAKRVGTMVVRYNKNVNEWQTGTYKILYGDITKNPAYKEESMRIQVEERYSQNSKGEMVPIYEVGWADADETPTHMILQFTSSHGGAYIGSPGNTMWIDNVKLIY